MTSSSGDLARSAASPSAPPAEMRARIDAARHVLTRVPGARSPLVLFDRDALGAQVDLWRRHLGAVEPHFAVKTCNAPGVLQHLHALGMSFDAATAGEIRLLERLGVPPERVICTHPIRDEEDLRAIARYRPRALVVESGGELRKLQRAGVPGPGYSPELIVRVELPFGGLSGKFGAEIVQLRERDDGPASWRVVSAPVRRVFQEARAIERDGNRYGAFGLSSHVGTNSTKVDKYAVMLRVFAHLCAKLAERGVELSVFDLGGGYCDSEKPKREGSTQEAFLAELGRVVREHAEHHPGVRFIAEPGRFMVSNSGTVVIGVMHVDERKLLHKEDGSLQAVPHLKVQMNDGLYGNLLGERHDEQEWQFVPLRLDDERRPFSGAVLPAILNGKTCDSWDRLERMRPLPRDLGAGDHLLVPHAGAYTIVTATDFNSAPRSQVCLYWRDESELGSALHDANGAEVEALGANERHSTPSVAPNAAALTHVALPSQDMTLSRIVGRDVGRIDAGLLRPGPVVSEARWEKVLSLVYQNDLALRLRDVIPHAESRTSWTLRARREGWLQPLTLRIGIEPIGGERAERFLARAAAVAGLSEDPRIAQLVEYGVLSAGNHPYRLETFVAGRTLAELVLKLHVPIAGARRVDWRRGEQRALLERVEAAALALAFAHERGVVHRHVRGANVLVPKLRNPPVSLLDWGLFETGFDRPGTESASPASLPSSEELESTSPAHARGEAPAPADDVWGLGATLQRLLCNRSPLEHHGDAERQLAALRAAMPGELVRRPSLGLPVELEAILAKALRRDPRERYASAAELALDLRRYLDGEPVHAHRESLSGPRALAYSAVRRLTRRRQRPDREASNVLFMPRPDEPDRS